MFTIYHLPAPIRKHTFLLYFFRQPSQKQANLLDSESLLDKTNINSSLYPEPNYNLISHLGYKTNLEGKMTFAYPFLECLYRYNYINSEVNCLAQSIVQLVKAKSGLVFKVLLLVSFAVPLLWLYFLDALSFELMWKGRTFQLFFIWLIGLELILDWENIQASKLEKFLSIRTIAFVFSLMFPTLYVVSSYYGGLNGAITNWATQNSIQWAESMPLSTEYLSFALLFCLIIGLSSGIKGLKTFFVPTFFLVLVGILYTIDNVFPYGQFTPFQIFVPTTTTLAAAFLSIMGYGTSITYEQSSLQGNMPVLTATNLQTNASSTFQIAWPCAGIESFLIFTVIILLFLKRMNLSWKSKLGYFVFGAIITYIINSLRIVSIFLIDMNGGNIDMFHFYYGPLIAMSWIVSYPVIILFSQRLWKKIRKPKQLKPDQQASLNPA